MRLAVFTSKYPARVTTFFERDMRALLEAGIEIEVFPIYPLDARLWRYSLDLLGPQQLPREKVHHVSLPAGLRRAWPTVRQRPRIVFRDALAILGSAVRFGAMPLAKTTYALPKAWAWAAQDADRFDHVLAYWGNYAGSCAYAFHRLLRRPVPFSIWLHAGTDLYTLPIFLKEKLAWADNIITCCEFNRDYLRQHFAVADPAIADRIHVSHHGLDLAEFRYQRHGRPLRHIIAVGRLSTYKGFDYLLRALHVLQARGVEATLELVGDGEEKRALQALATDLGIAERVRFRGWLRFPEAKRAMSEATLLVHPSDGLGDGLPNVVREAMALGTPVIASRVAGIPEALRERCGILVPPRNVMALADAIEKLLDSPDLRTIIASRARRRVEDLYDMWRNGARLARVLRSTRRGTHGSGIPTGEREPDEQPDYVEGVPAAAHPMRNVAGSRRRSGRQHADPAVVTRSLPT